MKILFASDISFNYYPEFPGKEAARFAMSDTAHCFEEADFSVVNLENIFGRKEDYTPIPKGGPNLISSPDFAEYIYALSPSAIGFANNHVFDFGEDPIYSTAELLTSRGYTVFGAGKNVDEAYAPASFEKDGVKVHVYAVCENEIGCGAKEDKAGAAGYNLTRIKKALKASRAAGALPVIYFHGGNEYDPFPSPGKVEMYRNFVDMGASAVVAMHTHCPQGYEIYEGAPIVYSMGNFFFPVPASAGTRLPSWSIGYMAELDVTVDSVSLKVIPYKFDTEVHTVLDGEEKMRAIEYIEYISRPIADERLVREYFDAWCMISALGYPDRNKLVKIVEEYTAGSEKNFASDAEKKFIKMKNVLGCEAHNELLVNTFNILYENRCDSALKRADEILRLQKLEY